jgi:hypothetical protein
LILRNLMSAIVRASFSPASRGRIGWILGAAGGLAIAGLLALAFTLASEPGAPAVDDMPRGTSARPQTPGTRSLTTRKEAPPAAGRTSDPVSPDGAVLRAESSPPPLPVQGPEPVDDRSRRSSGKALAPILGDD